MVLHSLVDASRDRLATRCLELQQKWQQRKHLSQVRHTESDSEGKGSIAYLGLHLRCSGRTGAAARSVESNWLQSMMPVQLRLHCRELTVESAFPKSNLIPSTSLGIARKG